MLHSSGARRRELQVARADAEEDDDGEDGHERLAQARPEGLVDVVVGEWRELAHRRGLIHSSN